MNMNKWIHIAIVLLFVGSVMPLVPSGAAQGGSDANASDAPGDVVLLTPSPDGNPSPVDGAAAPDPVAKPVDLTDVRFYGESPTEINIGFSVSSFARTNIQLMGSLQYYICFQWSGTGDWYQYRAEFYYPSGGSPSGEASPTYETGFLDRLHGECDPYSTVGDTSVFKHRFPPQLIITDVDLAASTLDVRIPRIAFENAVPEGESKGPVPVKGDTISGLQAHAVAKQGARQVLYDTAGGGVSTTLTTDTGNDVIRVSVPQNIQSAAVQSTGGVPIYGVEIGSFQTVPVTIENGLPDAIDANISFVPVTGDAAKWDIRVIKSIPVGPQRTVTVDGEPTEVPGSETVTLIVNSDASVVHKETLRLLITATDGKYPGVLGAALVDIVAVAPPTVSSKSIYFHALGNPCNSGERWLNTLKTDPAVGGNNEVELKTCVVGGGDVQTPGAGGGSLSFRPDVPFARDYVYDTTSPTTAKIALKSVERPPLAPEQEQNVPTTANVLVQVLAGSQLMGEGELRGVTIDGTAVISVPLTFVGTSPGATERLVTAEEPLGLRVQVTPVERTFIVCNDQEPCTSLGGEREQSAPASSSGRIFLLTDQSQVDLPIKSSERAGAQLNITASGALITLRLSQLDAPKLVFTNPGRQVVYNITVRNEGVNVDTAKISAKVNQTGWDIEILPTDTYKLDVGQPRSFNVRITAPEDAVEGQTAGITIVAKSTVDSEAEAKLPLLVKVTKGTQFEDQKIDENLQTLETEESPSGILVPSLVLLGLAFLVGRRRRD